VVGVSDGDTITVLDDAKVQHKIRLAGIDAPEKGQAFGERSKQRLSDLVFQKRVEVRCHKKDRYKREVPDQPSSGRVANLAPLNESIERLLFEDPIDRSGSGA
jgi:endonuclease YncB( thermonuclease family)